MLIYQPVAARCPAFLKTRRDARIVRLGEEALWIAAAEASEPPVAIARADWAHVHACCPALPEFAALPRARRRDLFAAWLADAPAPARAADATALLALVGEKLVACDGLDAPDAVNAVRSLVAWVETAPEGFIRGRSIGAGEVLTLFLDTRPTADWPALARRGGEWAFAFAGSLAIEAQAASADEAAEGSRSPAPRDLRDRQLVFSFASGPVCAPK